MGTEQQKYENYVSSLIEKTDTTEEETRKARELLEKDGKRIIIWSWEDVIDRANQNDQDYTRINRDDAENILNEAIENHDANYGISWESFDYGIDEIMEVN